MKETNCDCIMLKTKEMTNQEPNIVEKIRAQKSIGIQIGVESFMDEGVEQVLDILQEKGAVNALYISTFTYDSCGVL